MKQYDASMCDNPFMLIWGGIPQIRNIFGLFAIAYLFQYCYSKNLYHFGVGNEKYNSATRES